MTALPVKVGSLFQMTSHFDCRPTSVNLDIVQFGQRRIGYRRTVFFIIAAWQHALRISNIAHILHYFFEAEGLPPGGDGKNCVTAVQM
jgi:hypothetical protein